MLGLRCRIIYDADAAWNGGYWYEVCISDSGYPIWSIAWELWPCIIGNKIIPDLDEYIYGLCCMFVNMITYSLKYNIMVMV